MSRWLRRLGLALSLIACGALASHIHHADGDHAVAGHPCCLCHADSAAPTAVAAAARPATQVQPLAPAPAPKASVRQAAWSGAARAPPFS